MASEKLSPELEKVVAQAAAAAAPFAATTPEARAKALVAAADALEAAGPELIAIAMRETGLTEVRLTGEVKRTAVQLRLFAETILSGDYLDVRIDEADDNFALGQRPDVRRYHIPVGPVINFSASNFPFAFSVAGGDSAAALAAGCPLIVKGHSGHPELSKATAEVIAAALKGAGMPDGCFQLILGGHVVDFISTPWMVPAIYNVADIAIVSSMVIFIFLTLRSIGLDGTRSTQRAKTDAQ